MFNSPFDSFHDTVAKAKEEREELDRLLTISTPGERVLVGAIAGLMLALGAWLFLGSVDRTVAIDALILEPGAGVLMEPGEGPHTGTRSIQALARVGGDLALEVAAALPLEMRLATANGEADALEGEIVNIAAVPPPERHLAFGSGAAEHRIDILLHEGLLDEGIDVTPVAGGMHRIRIDLGRQSPAALFGLTRP